MDVRHQPLSIAAFHSRGASVPSSGAGALTNPLAQILGLQLAVMAEIGEAETARRKGMRRLDLKALRCIAQLEPLPTGRLVQILGMSPGGVNSILNRLEDEGLIRRGRSLQDRRQVSLYLANEQVLDQIFPDYIVAALRPVLDGKDPHEVERLIRLLTECLEATMQQANAEPHPTTRYQHVKGPAYDLSETS